MGLLLTAALLWTACGGGSNDSSTHGQAVAASPASSSSSSQAASGTSSQGSSAQDVSTQQAHSADASAAKDEGSSRQEDSSSQEDSAESHEDKPLVIGFGQPVEIMDYIPKGQTTIVDFYSQYCPPCMRISPYLDQLDANRDDITVIRVDINRPGKRGIDWASPVARQYNLRSIPHFQIYDGDRKLVAEGQKAYEQVIAYLQGQG